MRNIHADGSLVQAIPAELQNLRNWVNFSIEQRHGGKWKKTPYTPSTDHPAKVNDPATWRTYAEAVADAERTGRVPGVAITNGMNLTLIDIDGRTDHPLVAKVNSYTEKSVSGAGLHILARGRPPEGFVAPKGIEVYPRSGNRFAVITGDTVDNRDTIEERSAELAALFPARPEPARIPPALSVDDTEILRLARSAKNAGTFSALFDRGDVSPYGDDDSDADLALCSKLAFWSQNAGQIDRLFRQSALMREKWDRADYRERTIGKALRRDTFYVPATPAPEPPGDPCGTVRDELAELRAELAAVKAENADLKADRDRLSRLHSATMSLLRSGDFRAGEKIVALVSLFEAEAAQTRGATDAEGWGDAPLARLAESSGCSAKVAGKHLTTVASTGLLESRTIDRRDPKTGTLKKHRQLRVPPKDQDAPSVPALSLPDRIVALSTAIPARNPEKAGWGGTRRCPDCGDAGTVTTTTVACKGCGQVLSTNAAERAPAPNDQDGPSVSTPVPEPPKGHLALSKYVCGRESPKGQDDPSVEMVPAEPGWLLEALPAERSAKVTDHSRDQRRALAAADLAAREPDWISAAPDPWDAVPDSLYIPAPLFAPDPPRSVHFSDAGD